VTEVSDDEFENITEQMRFSFKHDESDVPLIEVRTDFDAGCICRKQG
jgi:hypothetical protein